MKLLAVLLGSSFREKVFQNGRLIPFSRGSSPPRDLLHPGIEPGFLTLQSDSLPLEPPEKPNISEFPYT